MSGLSPNLAAFRQRLKRRALLATIAIVVLAPLVILGAIRSIEGMRITPEKWMSPTNPQRQAFERFRQEFEGNDVIFVAWEGCTIDDPRLSDLQSALSNANHLPDVSECVPFERVLTGSSVVDEMTSPPLSLDHADAVERMQGVLIGPDGNTSCALVVLTYDGNEHRKESIEHLLTVTREVTGLADEELIVAGPPHDGVAIDAESLQGVNFYGMLSTAVAALLCYRCLRSWRIAGLIIGIACLGQGIIFAGVDASGLTLDAILIVAPPLVFVLTVSAGVHFTNYFLAQPDSREPVEAVYEAMKEGWTPCWLAAVTTAIGLASLSISGIAPVAAFGIIGAIGLMVTVTLLMSVLPDALCKWPIDRGLRSPLRATFWLRRLGKFVTSHSMLVLASTAVTILCLGYGLRFVRTSVDATALFADDTKMIRDYNWLEEHVGPSVPVEVVVRFTDRDESGLSRQVAIMSAIHEAVGAVAGVESVLSARSFLPEEAWSEASGPFVRQAIIRKRLHASQEVFSRLNYFHSDAAGDAWRVTGRVPATAGRSYGDLKIRIRQQVEQTLAAMDLGQSQPEVVYTGMMPLIESVQDMIMQDLFWSLLSAFGLIGVTIALITRRLGLAALVTLLNTFPVLVTFGLMGWLAIPIDIGSMMTAGVAMGIAVDDTLHFLCFYQLKRREGLDRRPALLETIESCGAAMFQTTFICSASMLVFALSAFVPTRQFGLLMASILVTALFTDLICLAPLLNLWRGFRQSHASGETSPAAEGTVEPLTVSTEPFQRV